jgi:hypothetical protein
MRKLLCIITALFVAIGAPKILRADSITYSIDQTLGAGSVTGTITTNGTIGILDLADLTGWNLVLYDGTNTVDMTQATSTALINGNDLTASLTVLDFNYSGGGFAPNYNDFTFNGNGSPNGQLCYTSGSNCWGPTGVGVWDVGGDFYTSDYVVETGNQVIAIASAPEPGTGSLMLIGIGFLWMMRKRIVQGPGDFALRMRIPF